MTASKHPSKYPAELAKWTLAAADEFKSFRFGAADKNDRMRRIFAFTNFWRACNLAQHDPKIRRGYSEAELERFAAITKAARILTTKMDPESWEFEMGPVGLLRPFTMRPISTSASMAQPVDEAEQESALAEDRANFADIMAKVAAIKNKGDIFEERYGEAARAERALVPRETPPEEPPKPKMPLTPEQEKAKQEVQAGVWRTNMGSLRTPKERQAFRDLHQCDEKGYPLPEVDSENQSTKPTPSLDRPTAEVHNQPIDSADADSPPDLRSN